MNKGLPIIIPICLLIAAYSTYDYGYQRGLRHATAEHVKDLRKIEATGAKNLQMVQENKKLSDAVLMKNIEITAALEKANNSIEWLRAHDAMTAARNSQQLQQIVTNAYLRDPILGSLIFDKDDCGGEKATAAQEHHAATLRLLMTFRPLTTFRDKPQEKEEKQ